MQADRVFARAGVREIELRTRLVLAGLVISALTARLLFLFLTGAYGRVINDDGFAYNQIAASLLAGHGFAWGPGQPTAFRLFGYPWFLAGIYGIFGPSSAAVQCLQALLGSLVVLPTYAFARRLGGSDLAGLLAGLMVAAHPVLIYLTGLLAPEALALASEMALLWWVADMLGWKRIGLRGLAGFVVLGALAILVRPELLLVLGLFPVVVAILHGVRSRQVRVLAGAVGLALFVAVAPPLVRNYAIFHAFIPFPTLGGATFWGANNASANGGWIMPEAAVWPDGKPPALGMRGWPELTEQQSQTRFYTLAWQWIKDNPRDFLTLLWAKLRRSWSLSYADETRAAARLPGVVGGLNLLFGAFALGGLLKAIHLARAARRRTRSPGQGEGEGSLGLICLLLVPIVAWLMKTLIFYGSARQTALALPVLSIFAAVAIAAACRAVVPALKS